MAQDSSQPGRVQAAGRLHQDRFGLGGDLGGQVVGADREHAGMRHRQLPGGQRGGRLGQGATEQGPGGAHGVAGRSRAHPQASPEPAGGGAGLDAGFGPGGTAGVDPGELVEPVAFQPVQQPHQDQHPLGPDGVGQPGRVLGGQPLDHRRQGCEWLRWPSRMVLR
jgi:hypothetical protein